MLPDAQFRSPTPADDEVEKNKVSDAEVQVRSDGKKSDLHQEVGRLALLPSAGTTSHRGRGNGRGGQERIVESPALDLIIAIARYRYFEDRK